MLGAPSAPKTDAEGLAVIGGFRELVEGHANKQFSEWTPVSYTTQVVAGTNYQAKVKVGDGEYIHVKIYEPLPGGDAPSVSNFADGVGEADALGF